MVGNNSVANLLQPAVNLKLVLKSPDEEEEDGGKGGCENLVLDLAAFDKLRFSVAKALSCTEAFKEK